MPWNLAEKSPRARALVGAMLSETHRSTVGTRRAAGPEEGNGGAALKIRRLRGRLAVEHGLDPCPRVSPKSPRGSAATFFAGYRAAWFSIMAYVLIGTYVALRARARFRLWPVVPAHLTALGMWVEALRLLPAVPRESRLSFSNGLGIGFMMAAHLGTFIGFFLTASLTPLLTAGLLFLTPLSFLCRPSAIAASSRIGWRWLSGSCSGRCSPPGTSGSICSGPGSWADRSPTAFNACAMRSNARHSNERRASRLCVAGVVGFFAG